MALATNFATGLVTSILEYAELAVVILLVYKLLRLILVGGKNVGEAISNRTKKTKPEKSKTTRPEKSSYNKNTSDPNENTGTGKSGSKKDDDPYIYLDKKNVVKQTIKVNDQNGKPMDVTAYLVPNRK